MELVNENDLSPKTALDDLQSPLLRILDPTELNFPEVAEAAEKALRKYYLTSDKAGTFLPPLVNPIDATVFLLRRKAEESSPNIKTYWFEDPTPKQNAISSAHLLVMVWE